ncbi:DUF3095 domain-containing protein [Rubricoccus marinus]|uniref:Adenylate cyclase n=1 Tax=Rubricoccus marinus TaxID=716817 RepID=A0A259U150_9BACT|nr:DUF3095 domain-containing protein [Rubricoccus marinus]OZC03753.1 hypothetical protein BSZ36_12625 [Rubricoccus marinus]
MPVDFYAALPALTRFADLADPAVYTPLPDSWTVVLTDVIGSTVAVQAGRYRDVNYVGAASIAAVLNASDRVDIPFVFGGDGATLVVPPDLLDDSLAALAALQIHASERLDLPLRVGYVSLGDIRAAGHEVAVARFQASPNYAQALFLGSGMGWAEDQIKAPATASQYASVVEPASGADPYAGLECRWEDIPSPYGETVSLLVAASGGAQADTYREVLREVEDIYGTGDAPHPITLDGLRLSSDPRRLSPEVALRHPAKAVAARAELWARNLLGRVLIRRKAKTSETDWDAYPRLLRAATDYRKFDGVLRMILAGTAEQRQRMERFLTARYDKGELAWGLHVSDRAVMTCLVYERMGQQVHFIDGANGGYTAAAVPFKKRLKALAAERA